MQEIPMAEMKGKRILVTGGTTGIGRATAIELARQGALIFIFGRHEKELKDALNAIREAGGEVEGITADQADHTELSKVYKQAKTKLGGLDVVIANAAISAEGLADMSDEDWRYAVNVNLAGYLDVTKQAAESFEDEGGDIILVGSIASDGGEEGTSVYAATKAGLQGFAASFRKEVAKRNIRVSLIEPGAVGSDMQESSPEEQRKKIKKDEMLKAEDVAELVGFILTRPERCTIPIVRIEPRISQ
jgi:3-hydroxy acid dehydrogenase/malonic semialdehyde reductase